MAKGVKIIDKDHGFKALMKTVLGLKKDRPSVAVGVLESSASRADGETTVLNVATFNEFGTKNADGSVHVPERSFIRAWFDQNRALCQKRLKGLLQRVIKGELTEEQALDQFGLWAQGSIQRRMASSIPPPNADSTVAKKGSSTTLIDTGQLRSSITYEIRKG